MEEFKNNMEIACGVLEDDHAEMYYIDIWGDCHEFLEQLFFNMCHMKTTELVNFNLMVEYTKEHHKQGYYISHVLII